MSRSTQDSSATGARHATKLAWHHEGTSDTRSIGTAARARPKVAEAPWPPASREDAAFETHAVSEESTSIDHAYGSDREVSAHNDPLGALNRSKRIGLPDFLFGISLCAVENPLYPFWVFYPHGFRDTFFRRSHDRRARHRLIPGSIDI